MEKKGKERKREKRRKVGANRFLTQPFPFHVGYIAQILIEKASKSCLCLHIPPLN